MHPAARAFALLALLALLAPGALAQQATLRVSLAPAELGVPAGGAGETTVRVRNDGMAPVTVSLVALNVTGGLTVRFAESELTVLPGATESTTARVQAPTEGDWRVRIHARANGTLPTSDGSDGASAMLRVLVGPPAGEAARNDTRSNATRTNASGDDENATPEEPPATNATGPEGAYGAEAEAEENTTAAPAPPRAERAQLTLEARPGERAPFELGVAYDGTDPLAVTMRLPQGWGGALENATLVADGGAAVVRGHVRPAASAEDAEGELEIAAASGSARVRLVLRALPAPAAAPATAAPAEVGGVADAEEEASPEEAAPAAPTPAAAPRLSLTPADAGAAPGETVVLTLRISNPGDAPLAGRASVDAGGFPTAIPDAAFLAPPRGEALVAIFVTVPEGASLGASAAGVARVDVADAAPAPFVVRAATADVLGATLATEPAESGAWGWALLGAGALASGAAALWRRYPGLGLLPLYARLAPHRALEHPRRARLLEIVREQPGLTLAEVQRRLELANGVARHHVALLAAAGAVRVVQDGPKRRVWPVDAGRVDAAPRLSERALAALRARGAMRASELAAELGVSRQALHYHVKRLAAEGRIVARREASELILMPAQG